MKTPYGHEVYGLAAEYPSAAALYEAANSHLRISKKWSVLRAWGVKLAKRIGAKKACVAVARKLAIIMHRMWVDGTDFRFGAPPATRAA